MEAKNIQWGIGIFIILLGAFWQYNTYLEARISQKVSQEVYNVENAYVKEKMGNLTNKVDKNSTHLISMDKKLDILISKM